MGQPGDVGADARRTGFHPAVPGVGFFVRQDGRGGVGQERSHVALQLRLVAFQGHDVVRPSLVQQRGAVTLRVQRIHRHVPPAQVQQLEQLRECGDLVGLAVHGHVADAQADIGGKRVQQAKGWNVPRGVRAAPYGLAVDGDMACRPGGDAPGEIGKHRLELLRLDEPEQPSKSVVGRRAALIGQVAAQELDLGPGELRVAVAAAEPAQRGAECREKHLSQAVRGSADDPWVVDPGEELASGRNHGAPLQHTHNAARLC